MNFFKKITNSIYSPDFYSSVLKSSLGSALKYFFLLILLVEIGFFAKLIPEFLFKVSGQVKNLMASAIDSYPKDLVVTIKSGQISTNVKEPYFISDKEENKLIVIDTKTPYSAAKFHDYKVSVWIAKDTIFYMGDGEGQIKSQNLNQFPDMTIDKNFVASLVDKVTPYLPYLGPSLLALMFVALYIGNVFTLVYLFFLAALIWLLTKLMGRGITYRESYKVGVYAITLALVVDVVKMFFAWPGFPFMFTLVSLVVVFINLRGMAPSKNKLSSFRYRQ